MPCAGRYRAFSPSACNRRLLRGSTMASMVAPFEDASATVRHTNQLAQRPATNPAALAAAIAAGCDDRFLGRPPPSFTYGLRRPGPSSPDVATATRRSREVSETDGAGRGRRPGHTATATAQPQAQGARGARRRETAQGYVRTTCAHVARARATTAPLSTQVQEARRIARCSHNVSFCTLTS